jgi:hypothetical protein
MIGCFLVKKILVRVNVLSHDHGLLEEGATVDPAVEMTWVGGWILSVSKDRIPVKQTSVKIGRNIFSGLKNI